MRTLTLLLIIILGGLIVYNADARTSHELSYDLKEQFELDKRIRSRRARLTRLRRRK